MMLGREGGREGERISVLVGWTDQYLPPLSLLLSLLLSRSLSRLRSLPPPPRLLSRLRLRPLFLSCSISSLRSGAFLTLSSLLPCRPYSSPRSFLLIGLRCMKLQNPDLVHSPVSYWRQQASRKSVTGVSSAYIGRPPNQRLLRSLQAFSASSSFLNLT